MKEKMKEKEKEKDSKLQVQTAMNCLSTFCSIIIVLCVNAKEPVLSSVCMPKGFKIFILLCILVFSESKSSSYMFACSVLDSIPTSLFSVSACHYLRYYGFTP